MFKLLKGFFLITSFFLISNRCLAEEAVQVIKDLRYEWKTHEPNLKILVPYLSENESAQSIIFFVNLKEYQGAHLFIDCPKRYSIYFDQGLCAVTKDRKGYYFSIDSLALKYPYELLELEIYSKNWNHEEVRTQIIRLGPSSMNTLGFGLAQIPRKISNDDLMIIVNMFIFVVMVVFRTRVYRLFKEYLMVAKSLRVRQKFDLIVAQDPISPISIAFMVLYALFVGGIFLNLQLKIPTRPDGFVWFETFSFRPEWEWALYIGLLALTFILSKVLLVNSLSRLFGFHRQAELHFYAYFRMTFLIAFAIYIFSLVIFISEDATSQFLFQTLHYLVISLFVIRLIMIYLILNNAVGVKKLHIISYLCSSELVPLIIIIKTLFR